MKQRVCGKKLLAVGNRTFYVRLEPKHLKRRERTMHPIRVIEHTEKRYFPYSGEFISYRDAQTFLMYYVPING